MLFSVSLIDIVAEFRPVWGAIMAVVPASLVVPGRVQVGYILAQRAHEVTQFEWDVPCIGGTDAI